MDNSKIDLRAWLGFYNGIVIYKLGFFIEKHFHFPDHNNVFQTKIKAIAKCMKGKEIAEYRFRTP